MKIKAKTSLATVLVTGLFLSACSQQIQNEPAVTAPKTGAAPADGHIHPANSMTRSTRHNHSNGARKHNHHYSK